MSIRRVHHLNCATMCPVGRFLIPLGLAAFERLTQVDAAARRASAAALRQLRTHYTDLDLFCAHDPAEFDALAS